MKIPIERTGTASEFKKWWKESGCPMELEISFKDWDELLKRIPASKISEEDKGKPCILITRTP